MSSARKRWVSLAFFIAALLACSDVPSSPLPEISGPAVPPLARGERWRPIHRWVDSLAAVPLPTATIDSETRPVLRASEPVTLNYAPRYRVPENGRVVLHPPLPPALDGADAEGLVVVDVACLGHLGDQDTPCLLQAKRGSGTFKMYQRKPSP